MALTRIQPGMLSTASVLLENFSATGSASSSTYLRGDNVWAAMTPVIGNQVDFGPIFLNLNDISNITTFFYALLPVDFGTALHPSGLQADFNNA